MKRFGERTAFIVLCAIATAVFATIIVLLLTGHS
jgi:hypothetical protein